MRVKGPVSMLLTECYRRNMMSEPYFRRPFSDDNILRNFRISPLTITTNELQDESSICTVTALGCAPLTCIPA